MVLLLLSGRDGSSASPSQKPQKRVLLLYSEDKSHPAHELTDTGIREAFRSNRLFDVRVYTEYLDVTRFSGPGHARAVADYLGRKYTGLKIDAVITIYPAALDMLLGEATTGLHGVPVVACEIVRSAAANLERSPSRRWVTGLIIGDNITGLLDSAFLLKPGTKHMALVAGTAPNDVSGESVFRNGLEPYAEKVDLIDLTKLSMEETLARVGSLPPNTIVLYSTIFTDGRGQSFVPREALELISRASNAPVFGLYDSLFGYGIVGGRLVSLEQQGREAAALALRIMGGESPASIPFGGEQAYVNAYDWRELKRWGISENVLPPGSVVRFKPPSIWEDHRGVILGVIFFIVIETLLVIGLFANLHKRKQAETKLREREKDLQNLTGRLIWGQEEERRRLARELHDDLTQRLAVLAIQAGTMEQAANDGRQPLLKEFHDLRDQAVQISADIHNISRQIHPSILDDLGLEKAVESECNRFSSREGIEVVFAAEGIPGTLPKDVALSFYRIIQEGLTNIAKHACARHATVSLSGTEHGLRLSVRDDGIGFDAAEGKRKPGLGLSSMRERVRIIHGELRIRSEPEKGTTIHVNVPLKERGTRHEKDMNGGDDPHEDNA